MKHLARLVAVWICAAAALSPAATVPSEARTDKARLAGVSGRTPAVRVFKEASFAAPPLGLLRWREPQPITNPGPAGRYTVAFASFAPLDTDLFVAEADGSAARPLSPHPDLDYNASFSSDGRWIVFTSHRDGSADIFRVRLDGSGFEKLVDHPSFDDQAVLSPDGRHLAFVSSRSGQADVWTMDLGTKALSNLTNQPGGDFRPEWSPDGRHIAFTSIRDEASFGTPGAGQNPYDIFVMRADGTDVRRITTSQFAGSPSWLPDGSGLVYYQTTAQDRNIINAPRRMSGGTSQIVSVDLATSARRELTSGPGRKWSPRALAGNRVAYFAEAQDGGIEVIGGERGARGEFRNPSWAPDGRRVVFHREMDTKWPPHRAWFSKNSSFSLVRTGIYASSAPGGDRYAVNSAPAGILKNDIWIKRRDGSSHTVAFSHATASALAPVWAPTGERLVFGLGQFFQGVFGQSAGPEDQRRGADIAVVDADGSNFRQLTHGGNRGFPSWAPDGNRVVYRALGGTGKGLLILNVSTGEERALTTSSFNDNFPAWSPTGDLIAFASDRDGPTFEIYTIRPDGSELRRITTSPGHDAHMAWSHDGRWLAFSSNRAGWRDEAVLHPFNAQNGDIYVMRPDGSDVQMLTDDTFEKATPGFLR
jgi:TolB protein